MRRNKLLLLALLVGFAVLVGNFGLRSGSKRLQVDQQAARIDSVAENQSDVTSKEEERQALVQPEQSISLVPDEAVEPKPKWTPSEMPLDVPSPFPLIVAEPGVPVDPSLWATVGALGRTPTPDSVFDAKYPPNTEPGLMLGNSMLLRQQAMKRFNEVAKAKFDAGDYEELQLPNEQSEFGTKYDTQFYLGADANGFPHYSQRRLFNTPTGRVKIAFCRFADHPDIYELLDEANYLSRRLDAQGSW